jgi:hypothetical protein
MRCEDIGLWCFLCLSLDLRNESESRRVFHFRFHMQAFLYLTQLRANLQLQLTCP